MCGIFGSRGINLDDHISEIKSILSLRGPDHIDNIEYKKIDPSLIFIASQLSFVGNRKFPLISSTGDILLANGEIYNYNQTH